MKILRVLLISFTIFFFSCDGEQPQRDQPVQKDTVPVTPPSEDTVTKAPPKTEQEEEEALVKLDLKEEDKGLLHKLDTISLNSSYQKVKESFPGVKGVGPEGGSKALADQGLTETKASAQFMEYPAEVEFNFKNDSLYSYYIMVHEPDPERSDSLYQGIHDYYVEKHGPCVEEKVEEETHFFQSCSWELDDRTIVITYNMNSGTITWGYQKPTEI